MKEVKMTILFVIVIIACLIAIYITNPGIIKEMDDALFNFFSNTIKAIKDFFTSLF